MNTARNLDYRYRNILGYKHPRSPSIASVCFTCNVQEYGECVNSSYTNLEVIFRNGDTATRANIFTSVPASPVVTPTDRIVVRPINTIPASTFAHNHTIEFNM